MNEKELRAIGFTNKMYRYTAYQMTCLNKALDEELKDLEPFTLCWFEKAKRFHDKSRHWLELNKVPKKEPVR